MEMPRTVVVTGATSTRPRRDATRRLVSTTTGRTLSRSAHHTSPWPSSATPVGRPGGEVTPVAVDAAALARSLPWERRRRKGGRPAGATHVRSRSSS